MSEIVLTTTYRIFYLLKLLLEYNTYIFFDTANLKPFFKKRASLKGRHRTFDASGVHEAITGNRLSSDDTFAHSKGGKRAKKNLKKRKTRILYTSYFLLILFYNLNWFYFNC